MADQEYSVKLDDEVSPGLLRIIQLLDKMEKKMDKGSKLPKSLDKTKNSLDKTTNSAKKHVDAIDKIDRAVNVIGTPLGQIANKFGFLGDLIESSSGKMMGMGGTVGFLGASLLAAGAALAVVAAGAYGVGKAAMFSADQLSSYTKSVMTVRGNLGLFVDSTEKVIQQSMGLSTKLGMPYLAVAEAVAKATKAGLDFNNATDFAYLRKGFEGLGESQKNVIDVMDQLASGKRFKKTEADLQKVADALAALEVTDVKPVDFVNMKTSKQQLETLMKNKDAIGRIKSEIEKSVNPVDKLQVAFANMFAKALGNGTEDTPLKRIIDRIIEWTDKPESIKTVENFFGKVGGLLDNIKPDSIDKMAKSVLDVADAIGKISDAINKTGKFIDAHPILAKMLGGGATGGVGGAISSLVIGAAEETAKTGKVQKSIPSSFSIPSSGVETEVERMLRVQKEAIGAGPKPAQPAQILTQQITTPTIDPNAFNAFLTKFNGKPAEAAPVINNQNKATITINTQDEAMVKRVLRQELKDMAYELK